MVLALMMAGCGGGGNSSSTSSNQPPPSVSVSVSPSTASVILGDTQQFSATVSGSSNSAVAWSVNGVAGGNSSLGTITSAGLYTAPPDLPNPASVTVTATSQASSTASANSTVSITSDVSVTVATSPANLQSLAPGGTAQLTATVTSSGHPDTTVNWSVDGVGNGNSTYGTVATTGNDTATYTAPASVPNPSSVTIDATSVADPSKSGSVSLAVALASPLTASAGNLTFNASAGSTNPGSQSFSVGGSTSTAISWTASVTTADGGNWLAVTPASGTTPGTVTVSTNIVGMGAANYSGTITLTPTGTNTTPLTVAVGLALASPQAPYFTGSYDFGLSLSNPQSVTLPDGSVLSDGSDQILAFLSAGVTDSQMQAVGSAITGAGGSVVGEILGLHELQIQLADVSKAGPLILGLETLPGVVFAGPNMALFNAQSSSKCINTTIAAGLSCPTNWMQSDTPLTTVPPAASNVVIGVVDCFNPNFPGCVDKGTGLAHGEIVQAFAQQAADGSAPVEQVPITPDAECTDPTTGKLALECFSDQEIFSKAAEFVAQNPGKTVVLNFSQGAEPVNSSVLGQPQDSIDENEDTQFYAAMASYFQAQTGQNVLVVKAAGNSGAPIGVPSAPCNLLDVGGLDQTSNSALSVMANFSAFGPPVGPYAPACNVCPTNLQTPSGGIYQVSGTSFAAPQAAGLAAALMATNQNIGVCQVQSAISTSSSVPDASGAQISVLNDQAASNSASSNQGSSASSLPSIPSLTSSCPDLSVTPSAIDLSTGTNQTAVLTPALSSGISGGLFQFQSSNPSVATVDSYGNVTAVGPGVASIGVISPGVPCEAEATVVVNGEAFSGTMNFLVTVTQPNTIPSGTCSPNPLVTTGSETGTAIQVGVSGNLLSSGSFTGTSTLGAASFTLTVPAYSCTVTNPNGSSSIFNVAGVTQTVSSPPSSGTIYGTSNGSTIAIPVPGFSPITGTITGSGSTQQLALNWSFTQTVDGATVQVQLSAVLTPVP